VWLQWEVKPAGAPFDGIGIGEGLRTYDTGAPQETFGGSFVPMSEIVVGLDDQTRYRWRARMASRSPFFPRTPWLTMPLNAPGEMDFRTSGTILAAGHPSDDVRGPWLEVVPVATRASRTELAYVLAVAERVRLSIYDVQGRERAVLDDGLRSPGRHVVIWDGRTEGGAALSAGVYFVRLDAGDVRVSKKLVLAP
jgi:hypothetical protein